MAGDYLPMRLDLDEDPAVIQMAATLDMAELDVVGRLWKVWAWANRQTRDGNAVGVTFSWIDRYIGVTGFAHAMESAGWLEITEEGVSIPSYDRWNSKGAKTRLEGAKRVEKHREKKRKCNAPAVTEALPQDSTVQKSTEEKSTPDHNCSWNGRAVETTHLKDWCNATFGKLHAGRSRKALAANDRTKDLLLRIGVLRLADAVSEALIQDGCEALRTIERWPANPGGYLRKTWADSRHAPADLNSMLGAVELSKV